MRCIDGCSIDLSLHAIEVGRKQRFKTLSLIGFQFIVAKCTTPIKVRNSFL